MKKSKWLALAGVAVLSVGILAACSSKSSTSGTTYGTFTVQTLKLWITLPQIQDLQQLL